MTPFPSMEAPPELPKLFFDLLLLASPLESTLVSDVFEWPNDVGYCFLLDDCC